MKKRTALSFQKGDWAAVALVLLLAVGSGIFFWARKEDGQVVQIYQDGQLIQEFSLAEDRTFEVSGKYHNKIEIRDGRAAVTESDCPGEDCVYSGWIGEAGRSVICLPNRVEVRITGGDGLDFIVR